MNAIEKDFVVKYNFNWFLNRIFLSFKDYISFFYIIHQHILSRYKSTELELHSWSYADFCLSGICFTASKILNA